MEEFLIWTSSHWLVIMGGGVCQRKYPWMLAGKMASFLLFIFARLLNDLE